MEQKQPLTQTALSVVHLFKSDKDFQDNLNTIKDNELCFIPNIELYPVGSIYMSTINVDPAQLFGGKWQALNEGRVLIGANGSYPAGSKGGAATHTLSTSEMPSHSHSGSSYSTGSHKHSDAWGEHTSVGSPAFGFYNTSNNKEGSKGTGTCPNIGHSSSGGSHSHSVSISSAGGNSSHNNMMPYHSVYMWYRVS